MADPQSSLQPAPSDVPLQTSSIGETHVRDFAPSDWCFSRRKRAFDLVCAASLLAALLPLMILVIAIIRLTSSGPALFRQKRVGRDGQYFRLLKFRSMVCDFGEHGPELTRTGDPRVTPIGRVLRKWKLDELPQLLNVLLGDMSLVGPRPHVPELLGPDSPQQRSMLSLRPGITGLASIRFRKEEDMLPEASCEQLRNIYLSQILPAKIAYELQYARTASFLSDAGMLLRTASAVLLPAGPATYPVTAERLPSVSATNIAIPAKSAGTDDFGEAA